MDIGVYGMSVSDRIAYAVVEEGGVTSSAARSSPNKVRLNLDVSEEIADFLDTLAAENATTKTDVMRRAIALLKVAHDEKKRNRSMGFVRADRDDVLETRVVGVL